MDRQRCGSCKEDQDIEQFAPSARGKVGMWCRSCRRASWHGKRVTAAHPPVRCCWCDKEYVPKGVKTKGVFLCSQKCNWERRVSQGRYRESFLQRTYGISSAEYDRMLAVQGGGCALCGKTAEEQQRYRKYLHVDHCHETGRIRGLLCDRHNLLIGQWNHDPALLRRAVEYLEAAASL